MTTTCCDQIYLCPQTREWECAVHGGFDTCCALPNCAGNAA